MWIATSPKRAFKVMETITHDKQSCYESDPATVLKHLVRPHSGGWGNIGRTIYLLVDEHLEGNRAKVRKKTSGAPCGHPLTFRLERDCYPSPTLQVGNRTRPNAVRTCTSRSP